MHNRSLNWSHLAAKYKVNHLEDSLKWNSFIHIRMSKIKIINVVGTSNTCNTMDSVTVIYELYYREFTTQLPVTKWTKECLVYDCRLNNMGNCVVHHIKWEKWSGMTAVAIITFETYSNAWIILGRISFLSKVFYSQRLFFGNPIKGFPVTLNISNEQPAFVKNS